MPVYAYSCSECGYYTRRSRKVLNRNLGWCCPECEDGLMVRQFEATVNILVPTHFRVNQRDLLPPKGDPAWQGLQMGGESQIKERPSAGDQLAKALKDA